MYSSLRFVQIPNSSMIDKCKFLKQWRLLLRCFYSPEPSVQTADTTTLLPPRSSTLFRGQNSHGEAAATLVVWHSLLISCFADGKLGPCVLANEKRGRDSSCYRLRTLHPDNKKTRAKEAEALPANTL